MAHVSHKGDEKNGVKHLVQVKKTPPLIWTLAISQFFPWPLLSLSQKDSGGRAEHNATPLPMRA